MFHKGKIIDYGAAYRTAVLATPYAGFNNDLPYAGMTRTEKFPFQYNGIYGMSYTNDQINSSIDRVSSITLGEKNASGTEFSVTSPFELTSQEVSYFSFCKTPNDFRKYFILQNAKNMAGMMDQALIDKALETFADAIGDPTLPVNGFDSLSLINAMAADMELLDADSELIFGMSPRAYNQIQTAYPNYFNQKVNLPILTGGRIASGAGISIYSDNMMRRLTNGTFSSPGTVQIAVDVINGDPNARSQTITLKGFTPNATNVLRWGNYIYIGTAGDYVEMLSSREHIELGRTKTFFVLGNGAGGVQVDADDNGEALVKITNPPIFDDGSASPNPYRNVNRQIVTNDVVNLYGGPNTRFIANLVYLRKALWFCNPAIASYPAVNSGGKEFSVFAYEKVERMMLPGTEGLELTMNMAGAGNLNSLAATWALRTMGGGLAVPTQGFIFLSKE